MSALLSSEAADCGARLDTLPSEIILHIAKSTCPRTALTLSKVCKSLHQVCLDPLLFGSFFKDRQWVNKHLLSRTQDVDLIARYAVAEYDYLKLVYNVEANVGPEADMDMILTFVPNLVLLASPVFSDVCDLGIFRAGRQFVERPSVHDLEIVEQRLEKRLEIIEGGGTLLSFVYCFLSSTTCNTSAELQVRQNLHAHYRYNFFLCYWNSHEPRHHKPSLMEVFHANCMFGAGNLASLVQCALSDGDSLVAMPIDPIHPPSMRRISFANSPMDIPKPYLPTADSQQVWTRYIRNQRRARSQMCYLDDGEWVGMYTHQPGDWDHDEDDDLFLQLDEAMTGIHFRSEEPQSSNGNGCSRASGTDQVGDFELLLVWDTDGYIWGRKTYTELEPPLTWNWYLSNTPFGLFGVWTSEERTGPVSEYLGGAVWLWKKAWCEPRTEE